MFRNTPSVHKTDRLHKQHEKRHKILEERRKERQKQRKELVHRLRIKTNLIIRTVEVEPDLKLTNPKNVKNILVESLKNFC